MPPNLPDVRQPDRVRSSGAWRPGDPVAARRFAEFGVCDLELGGALPVTLAYETVGAPQRDAQGYVTNAVLVLHALTGDAHVTGPAGPGQPTPGWWSGLIGPGEAVDTERWWVVAANVLGGCQGSTGPASADPSGRTWGSRFGRITVRDQVRAEARLAETLNIQRFAAVIGGSMGGMRALEWAVMYPDAVGTLVVIASTAAASADQIGTQSAQLAAITSDPGWHGGDYHDHDDMPAAGLGLARRIAHLSYRSSAELDARFGQRAQPGEDPLAGGRFAIQSYLDHHAEKLIARFDAGSYVALTDAMNTHDVGRGRGGVAAALAAVTAPATIIGIDSDRLYPLRQQAELVALLPNAAPLHVIESAYGHDGFLIETEAVGAVVAEVLDQAIDTTPSDAGLSSSSLRGSTRTV